MIGNRKRSIRYLWKISKDRKFIPVNSISLEVARVRAKETLSMGPSLSSYTLRPGLGKCFNNLKVVDYDAIFLGWNAHCNNGCKLGVKKIGLGGVADGAYVTSLFDQL